MHIRKAIVGDEEDIQSLILKAVDPQNNPDFDEEGKLAFISHSAPNTPAKIILVRDRSHDYQP